jgi:hypothetical protein
VALPRFQGRQGECIGEDAGARDLSVCLVLGLALAGIGAGGATGAAVANDVRVIVLAVGAFVVITVFTRWAGPPSPYSRTGPARHYDDRPTACGTARGCAGAPGPQVLVPQRIEPARRVRELSDAQVNDRQAGVIYPGPAEFRKAIADAPADRREVLQRLAEWAEALEQGGLVRLVSYVGKNGGVTLLPRLASDNAGLVTIYADSNRARYISGQASSSAAHHVPSTPFRPLSGLS